MIKFKVDLRLENITLVVVKSLWSTSVLARPIAVVNMHQKGYPSHSMTGRHDSVMSICLTCHVYTFSSHRSVERFIAADFCLQSMSSVCHEIWSNDPFVSGHARPQRNCMEHTKWSNRGPSETLFKAVGSGVAGVAQVAPLFLKFEV